MKIIAAMVLALAATGADHGCDPWGAQMDRGTPLSEKPCRTAGEVPWGCVARSQADCSRTQLIPVCSPDRATAEARAVPHVGIGWYLQACAPFDPAAPPVWWTPQDVCDPMTVACGSGEVDAPCVSDADCASCLCDTVTWTCTG